MTVAIIITAIILILCVFSSKFLHRFGVPTLLIFILLGMVFGSDGIVGIYFDNYGLCGNHLLCRSDFHHVLWRLWHQLEHRQAGAETVYLYVDPGSNLYSPFNWPFSAITP